MTAKEHYKAWYKKNRARKIAQVRSWNLENNDKVKASKRKHYENNKDYYHQAYLDKKVA